MGGFFSDFGELCSFYVDGKCGKKNCAVVDICNPRQKPNLGRIPWDHFRGKIDKARKKKTGIFLQPDDSAFNFCQQFSMILDEGNKYKSGELFVNIPQEPIDATDLFHHVHHKDGKHCVHHCGGELNNPEYEITHCKCGKHKSNKNVLSLADMPWRLQKGIVFLLDECPDGGYHLDKAQILYIDMLPPDAGNEEG